MVIVHQHHDLVPTAAAGKQNSDIIIHNCHWYQTAPNVIIDHVYNAIFSTLVSRIPRTSHVFQCMLGYFLPFLVFRWTRTWTAGSLLCSSVLSVLFWILSLQMVIITRLIGKLFTVLSESIQSANWAASFEASCQWLVATVTSRTPLFTFTVGLCQHTFLFGRCMTDSFEIFEAQVREPLPKVGWLIGALNPVLHQG